MNKLIKYSAVVLAGLSLVVSCDIAGFGQKELLDTAQYSDTRVTLASFGPNPVMRGATLRFFGSNLEQVVEVQVPGVDPITSIEVVKDGKIGEIRVQLPAEGTEPGYVTLVTKNGTKLVTQSELTYSEPIVFSGFDAPQACYPGDVVTIKGDYMNLVKSVTFAGGTKVEEVENIDRYTSKVVVPADAISGTIILSDEGDIANLLYSPSELKMGKPTVKLEEDCLVKAGSVMTFEGSHLEMIGSVLFPTADGEIEAEDFGVVNKGGKLYAYLPETAVDGTAYLISYEGDRFAACEYRTVVPLNVTMAPVSVYKAAKEVVFSGFDLDLVRKVDFNGAEAGFSFNPETGNLTASIPVEATDGEATITLANGKTQSFPYELVKPVITEVSPLELYAGDEPVKVSGTDLDLVTAARIGTKDVAISEQNETGLTLATDVTSVGGKVLLTLANGTTLESEQEVRMNYHSKVIVTSRPAAQHIGQEVVLVGQNMDLVETIFIGETKVTKYGLRTPEEIRFLMPWCKVGQYELRFHLYDGDVEVQADPIEVQLEQDIKTVWEGSFTVGGWDGAMQDLAWGGYDWSTVSVGTELIVHYLINTAGDYHQIRAGNGSWSAIPSWKLLPGSDADGNVPVSEDGYLAVKLTAGDLYELVNNGGLVMCGAYFIVTKIQLVSEISQEITVYQGPCNLTWDDTGRFGIAMTYFEQCNPGSKLIFYINQNGVWGQIQLNDGWWANGDMKFAELGDDAYIKPDFVAADVTRVEITLTEALLSHILETPGDYFGINSDTGDGRCGMVVQGSDWTIEKVTILP